MSKNIVKTARKRRQRKNNLDIPQRLLDRLTPSVLETPILSTKKPRSHYMRLVHLINCLTVIMLHGEPLSAR